MVKTSETDPIRIDFVPAEALGLPGRLGMTFAPGKRAAGIGGQWSRDLEADLHRIRSHYDIGTVLCLLEDDELAELGIPDYAARVAAHAMELHRHPVMDGGVPSDALAFRRLLEQLRDQLRAGVHVVAHCRGGLGRAGTAAACLLVLAGHAPMEAMAIVRKARPGAVETRVQEQFIRRFAGK